MTGGDDGPQGFLACFFESRGDLTCEVETEGLLVLVKVLPLSGSEGEAFEARGGEEVESGEAVRGEG